MKKLKRIFAKWVYRIIRPYFRVDTWKSPMTMHISFTLNIFGEKVSEIEFSQRELVERRTI